MTSTILRGFLVGLTLSLIACGGSAFSSGSTQDAGDSDALDTESDAAKSDAAPDVVQSDAPQEANSTDSSTPGDSSSPDDAASDACVEYMHNDGFGVYVPDCTKCGYNSTSLALISCQTYAATHSISAPCQPESCGGYGLSVSGTACYTWVYQGSMAGYIVLAFSNGCTCVNGGGGVMTYGQCQ